MLWAGGAVFVCRREREGQEEEKGQSIPWICSYPSWQRVGGSQVGSVLWVWVLSLCLLLLSGDLLFGEANPQAEGWADPGQRSTEPSAAGPEPAEGRGEAEGSSRQGGSAEQPQGGDGKSDIRAENEAHGRDRGSLEQGKGFAKSSSAGWKGNEHPKGQLDTVSLRKSVWGSLELKKEMQTMGCQSHSTSVGCSGVLGWKPLLWTRWGWAAPLGMEGPWGAQEPAAL